MFKTDDSYLHPLEGDFKELPQQFTYPFYYEPHPLSIMAAKEVQAYLKVQNDFNHNFGLDGTQQGLKIGFVQDRENSHFDKIFSKVVAMGGAEVVHVTNSQALENIDVLISRHETKLSNAAKGRSIDVLNQDWIFECFVTQVRANAEVCVRLNNRLRQHLTKPDPITINSTDRNQASPSVTPSDVDVLIRMVFIELHVSRMIKSL